MAGWVAHCRRFPTVGYFTGLFFASFVSGLISRNLRLVAAATLTGLAAIAGGAERRTIALSL